jgi:hypothetical protein
MLPLRDDRPRRDVRRRTVDMDACAAGHGASPAENGPLFLPLPRRPRGRGTAGAASAARPARRAPWRGCRTRRTAQGRPRERVDSGE